MTEDQIEVDWIHQILNSGIGITIVCSGEQSKTLERLQRRKELPDNCLLLPMEVGEDALNMLVAEADKQTKKVVAGKTNSAALDNEVLLKDS